MLKFLGIGSAFNSKDGNNSAYIKQNASLIIIDCGSTVFGDIKAHIDTNDPNDIHIFITHTHTDHIGSLGTTLDYIYHVKGGKANLYFPQHLIVDILTTMKVDHNRYILHTELTHTLGALTISFYQTNHVLDNCYGLLINDSSQTICYSGDCSDITLLEDFLLGKLHILYLDVTDTQSKVHVMYNDLLELVPDLSDRNRVYLMHFNENFDKAQAIKDGFNIVERERNAL